MKCETAWIHAVSDVFVPLSVLVAQVPCPFDGARVRGTQRLFSVKYLFGEANVA